MSWFSQILRAVVEETPAGRRASEQVLEAYERAVLNSIKAAEIERKAVAAKRDWAAMETLRALKECYPERWEEIYTALGVKK